MADFQGGNGSLGTRRSTVRCGACKLLKRKCTSECIFAPYFGTNQCEYSFAVVHKVFGASNISKILSSVPTNHHHEAVATISYETQARLSDPIYGCVHHSCLATTGWIEYLSMSSFCSFNLPLINHLQKHYFAQNI
jgi:hypothetical protein